MDQDHEVRLECCRKRLALETRVTLGVGVCEADWVGDWLWLADSDAVVDLVIVIDDVELRDDDWLRLCD